MQDLLKNEWINGTNLEVLSTTPLATPDVLSLTRGSVSTIQTQITATLSAFHKAHRAGFRLQDVSNAPLVRRRKRMREEGGSSGSTDSSRSSTPVPPSMNFQSPLALGKTTSPTLGIPSAGPGTSGFQPLGNVTHTVSGSEPLPPLSVIVTSVPNLTVWDPLLRDDSVLSCGFSLRNSPLSHSLLPHPAESTSPHRSTPSHSPASRPGSSSSHGSTPQRLPLSRAASVTSMGFSPATSAAANSSDNSFSDPAAVSQIPPASLMLLSSSSQSDGSFAASFRSDDVGRKRKWMDEKSCNRNGGDSDDDSSDDDCVIVDSKSAVLSSPQCKKPRTQL